MLLYSLHDAVISIGSLMIAFKSLKSGVFGDSQSDSVLHSELLEFSDDTVSNVGNAFAQQTVHTGFEDV